MLSQPSRQDPGPLNPFLVDSLPVGCTTSHSFARSARLPAEKPRTRDSAASCKPSAIRCPRSVETRNRDHPSRVYPCVRTAGNIRYAQRLAETAANRDILSICIAPEEVSRCSPGRTGPWPCIAEIAERLSRTTRVSAPDAAPPWLLCRLLRSTLKPSPVSFARAPAA